MKEQRTFHYVYDEWYQKKRNFVKESTMSCYATTAETHLVPRFGIQTSINEQEVQDFVLLKLREGLSHKTVKDMVIVLRMVVRYGCRMGYFEATPWDIRFPKECKKGDLEVMSIENQRQLLSFLHSNINCRNVGLIICMNTGLRIGELCALKWKDIDLRNGVLRVSHTLIRVYKIDDNTHRYTNVEVTTPKTVNSIREIPLTNSLTALLKPLCKVMNEEYFIMSNNTKPIEPRTLRNYFNRILDNLNIPRIKFHGLRHSFATRCIESRCDYKTVSMILGHSSINTTLNLYVHPDNGQKKKCIEKMIRTIQN